jgi:hypothetical protein
MGPCVRRDDEVGTHTLSFSRLDPPEFCKFFRPKEGVGNAGCPMHPQPRV